MSEEEDSVILERTLESFEVTFGVLVLVLLIFFAACKGCRRCDSSSQANDVEKDGENAQSTTFGERSQLRLQVGVRHSLSNGQLTESEQGQQKRTMCEHMTSSN